MDNSGPGPQLPRLSSSFSNTFTNNHQTAGILRYALRPLQSELTTITMANTKEAKRDLIPHITFPIPSLKDIPRPADKEQRIKTIIANLDKHHQTARLSIIEAAKLRLEEEHQALEQNKQVDDEDNMDLSPIMSPPDGIELFLSNLHAPYHESMGDPCYYNNKNPAPSGVSPHRTSAEKEREQEQEEKMSQGVPQKIPPVEIRLARETLAQIARYDAHALPARKFYTDALSRSMGGGGVGGVGGGRRESTMINNSSPRRVSSTGGGGGGGLVAALDPSWRSGSTTTATTTGYTTSRTGSATFTPGRVDPRLANRSGSGTLNSPLAQSPSERESARPSDPRLRGR